MHSHLGADSTTYVQIWPIRDDILASVARHMQGVSNAPGTERKLANEALSARWDLPRYRVERMAVATD